ncbi:2-polyprenyl-6-methoxyphenol hydroxylase [Nonomuraea solani]|uniref:2-polyprenyl-6-methoxyphenol hydroxylase n=1 Tax=Nonomuraea solani TaxID=1144553 RepID=A0A1H6BTU5_9ACTN|nr:FAD-dependent monooxygenase [Nonomuraea solani]SEG64124.1 2-polyprenyl-6-methoxyphenol hydroxylase [Nonomuraea solani]
MMDTEVIVVGAGPAGLMLAGELGLAGVRALVVERHERRPDQCRGFNLNARSLELLDRRGIAERFLAEGPTVPYWMFGDPSRPLDLTAMETDHPYALGIAQTRVEELLEEWVAELGVPIRRGCEVVGVDDGPDAVTVRTSGGDLRASYVVGCDGARSTVRRLAGIGFPGTAATEYTLLGDVVLSRADDLPFGVTHGENGVVFVIPRPGYVRIVTKDPAEGPVTLEYFQDALEHALGRRVPIGEVRWLTRFGNAARQADRYVAGRVVLAGDAAHIHPPAGAVGVNVALADAVNLGWKLAATVQGRAPDGLLESYHAERHAAGALVLRHTRVQELLGGDDPRLVPLRELFSDLAGMGPVNRYLAELTTGVSTRYGAGEGHPWLGRLAPNLALTVDGSATSVARLLRTGRGVLLDFDTGRSPAPDGGRSPATDAGHSSPWVDAYAARCDEQPDLVALLIRPDGHTAWVATRTGDRPATSLDDALTTWFGDAAG